MILSQYTVTWVSVTKLLDWGHFKTALPDCLISYGENPSGLQIVVIIYENLMLPYKESCNDIYKQKAYQFACQLIFSLKNRQLAMQIVFKVAISLAL